MSSEESRRVLSPGTDATLRSKSSSSLSSADAASRSKDEGNVTTERFRDDFLLAVDKDGRVVLAESSSDRSRTADLRLVDLVGVRAAALFNTIRVGILYSEMMIRRSEIPR
jgi:hypothetical protein